jgi:microtubule-associated protein-like 1/2
VLGSSVLGIWPQGADGTDVNSCARSRSADLLAVGDDFGRVRLFNHPTSSIKVP